MSLRVILAAAASLCALVCAGCAFISPAVGLLVLLPDEQPPWAGHVPVRWILVYPDAAGELTEVSLSPGQREVEIETVRALQVPVAAYPLGRLRPAGGFVSHRVARGQRLTGTRTLRLSWGEGAAADLMLELWWEEEKRLRVDARYLSTLLRREGGGDPWSCRLERVRSAILFGSLSSVHVSRAETFEVELGLPAQRWLCASVSFAGTVAADPDGAGGYSVTFTGLYPGIHRFYSPEADLELHISVDKTGDSRHICDSPGVFSR